MNEEALEAELVSLIKQNVMVVVPTGESSSLSLAGKMDVITTKELKCGFHLSHPTGGWALIFFAQDVKSIESAGFNQFAKVIRLKKS